MGTHNIDLFLANLAPNLRGLLFALSENVLESLEEIRLRKLRPLAICRRGKTYFVTPNGELSLEPTAGYLVSHGDLMVTVQLISKSSLYVFEEELKQGFLTLPGGYRVGVAGQFILSNRRIIGIKEISSLNFRLAREIIGCATPLLPRLVDTKGRPYSTLIVSPPQCGKTTLLRDLARQLSYGSPSLGLVRSQVVVVDERSEIAGVYDGVPQMDVGPCTDVLDACPKPEGILMAIRSLAPDVIVTDEVGTSEDVAALQEAVNAGVRVFSSVHAGSWQELEKRPSLQPLLTNETFTQAVLLSRRRGPGTIEGILRLTQLAMYNTEVAQGV